MRITLPTSTIRAIAATCACLSLSALVGCAQAEPDPAPDSEEAPAEHNAEEAPAPGPAPDQGLPITELPVAANDPAGQCPYLDSDWVADANGQKVTGIGVDMRFDTPACLFWSYPEDPQLTVLVRHMTSPQEAMAVVDWAAPIDYTDPADDPEGWNGGRHGDGAVPGRVGAAYSVAKDNVAVTVFTNQAESVKAQVVAEEVITNLGL